MIAAPLGSFWAVLLAGVMLLNAAVVMGVLCVICGEITAVAAGRTFSPEMNMFSLLQRPSGVMAG